MVSDKKIFSCFPYINQHKTCDPGAGPIWPKGHNLNKLARGPLGDATYQISRDLGLVVSDKKTFSYFPYISLCKTCDPLRRSHFVPKGLILNKRSRGPLDDASYKILRL